MVLRRWFNDNCPQISAASSFSEIKESEDQIIKDNPTTELELDKKENESLFYVEANLNYLCVLVSYTVSDGSPSEKQGRIWSLVMDSCGLKKRLNILLSS